MAQEIVGCPMTVRFKSRSIPYVFSVVSLGKTPNQQCLVWTGGSWRGRQAQMAAMLLAVCHRATTTTVNFFFFF